jgi:rod shape-determining protein MreC
LPVAFTTIFNEEQGQPLRGGKYYPRILFWVPFVGLLLILFSSSSAERSSWNPVWKVVIEATSPFQKITNYLFDGVEDFWLNYFDLVDVRKENLGLKGAVDQLKVENRQYQELLSTHERLKNLLQFKQAKDLKAVAAQVIGLDPTGWFRSVIVNKGKDDAVEIGMPVVNSDGVVGKIVSLSPNYSKVLLVLDQNSAVDCLVQRSRDRGIIKGLSAEICEMNYVTKSSDIAVGDLVVTSGLDGVFPKGIPVGEVLTVDFKTGRLFKDVEIKPAVDFSKLEEVLILLKGSELSNVRQEEN